MASMRADASPEAWHRLVLDEVLGRIGAEQLWLGTIRTRTNDPSSQEVTR
ncbi:MAG: hypothetical protein ACRDRL_33805 [Sciscionella sp.]